MESLHGARLGRQPLEPPAAAVRERLCAGGGLRPRRMGLPGRRAGAVRTGTGARPLRGFARAGRAPLRLAVEADIAELQPGAAAGLSFQPEEKGAEPPRIQPRPGERAPEGAERYPDLAPGLSRLERGPEPAARMDGVAVEL